MDSEGRLEFVRYDENHWVLHLDRERAAALVMLIGRLPASSQILGADDYGVLAAAFKHYERELLHDYMDANEDLVISDALKKPKGEQGTEEDKLAELKESKLWKSFEAGVPDERKDEVLRQLMRVKDKKLDGELSNSFLWSTTPQGHDYWYAWSCRVYNAEAPLPPVLSK